MPRTISISAVALFFSLFTSSFAQNTELQISETYSAVVKESPTIQITRIPGETNYLVYGIMHFYEDTFSGAIIKVDA